MSESGPRITMLGGLKPEAFEAVYGVARECLAGTPMTIDEHAAVHGNTRTMVVVFNVEGIIPWEISMRADVNVELSIDRLNAGGEELNREVVAACNRARASISTALRATAAKLEPR